jgi:hypothetical protein
MKRHIFNKSIFAAISTLAFLTTFLSAGTIRPDAPEGARASIQAAIDALPATGGTVFIPAGRYVLDGMIHINRSHVALRGEPGTLLFLGDGVKQPNLLIGSDVEAPGKTDKIRDVFISGIEFDGNKDAQDSEFHPTKPWLRNNTIDIRATDDLIIGNVNAHNARSGGIVASWDCERMTVRGSAFHHNFFDGIALYDSRHLLITEFLCYANNAAGLSLDNRLLDVTFANGHIYGNRNVGIFARDSDGLNFRNLVIRDNGSFGSFLSHTADPDKGPESSNKTIPETGIRNSNFSGCSFINNRGHAIWMASVPKLSHDNSAIGCTFSGNVAPSIKGGNDMLKTAGNLIHNEKPAAPK